MLKIGREREKVREKRKGRARELKINSKIGKERKREKM